MESKGKTSSTFTKINVKKIYAMTCDFRQEEGCVFIPGIISTAWLICSSYKGVKITSNNSTMADQERNNFLQSSVFLKGNSEFMLSINHYNLSSEKRGLKCFLLGSSFT